MPEYIDAKRLSEILKIAPSTLERWRAQGRLPPSVKLGRLRRYSLEAVKRWLAEVQHENDAATA